MDAWQTARIEALKTIIVAYEAAITALVGGEQSYMLDTGQSKQSVTKVNLMSLQTHLDSLYNSLFTLERRFNGGAMIARPSC